MKLSIRVKLLVTIESCKLGTHRFHDLAVSLSPYQKSKQIINPDEIFRNEIQEKERQGEMPSMFQHRQHINLFWNDVTDK